MCKSKNQKEFPICSHPELVPTMWGQQKPEPVHTVGTCPIHDYTCPVCGFGAGQYPACGESLNGVSNGY